MGLRDIEIKDEYRTENCNDLGKEFISPILKETLIYKRAAGFFSSSSLIKLTEGLSYLTKKRNCHIYIVASPKLNEEDIAAIDKGYENKNLIIEKALNKNIFEHTEYFEIERLNYLCHLIEEGILDIKIAICNMDDKIGMFHEKIGIFIDEDNNKVAFTGSLNESDNAYCSNFESVDVYKSWQEVNRTISKEEWFDRLWNNDTNNLEVFDFPESVKKNLFTYRKDQYIKNIDEKEIAIKQNLPKNNLKFELYEYQKEAINKWAHQYYKGLFNMGTGTGKTITALTASVKLLERLKYRLAVIIVCPYKHLVEQWVEEKDNFNINFIVGSSNYKYRNYKNKLIKTISYYNSKTINNFYFITTTSSYKKNDVQQILSKIDGDVLFIADEVHNCGSPGFKKALNEKYKYRIGLSATIDRHNDDQGTQAIYDYFGDICINYGLKEAIESGVLTRYYYKPIVVTLDYDEQSKYIELTKEMNKCWITKDGKTTLSVRGKKYAIERSRVVALASAKVKALKQVIEPFKEENNLLIYCGSGSSTAYDDKQNRQIDEVCKMLGNELGMAVNRYTSQESDKERKQIMDSYSDGGLQALVAIKCLDEGVNIPSIKKAFILASTKNPREYIQRRGRVLRKAPNKKYAYIYDFVTLPVSFDEMKYSGYDSDYINYFISLIYGELERIEEFSKLSENESESYDLQDKIKTIFKLNTYKIEDLKMEYILDKEDEDE